MAQEWLCWARGPLLTYAVQPVHGHCLEGPAHHGVLLQHLVEVVHGEGVEAAVGVCSHAGRAPAPRQQADFCKERASLRTWGWASPLCLPPCLLLSWTLPPLPLRTSAGVTFCMCSNSLQYQRAQLWQLLPKHSSVILLISLARQVLGWWIIKDIIWAFRLEKLSFCSSPWALGGEDEAVLLLKIVLSLDL